MIAASRWTNPSAASPYPARASIEGKPTHAAAAEIPDVVPLGKLPWGFELPLLFSALFLQRFTLTFGRSLMELNVVPILLIFVYAFLSGRLVIQIDRSLWFGALAAVVTASLAFNFQSTMLTSYCLFIAMYSLFMFVKTDGVNRYRKTLQCFQSLMLVIALIAISQFAAQAFVDGRDIVRFYGLLPQFLFTERFNTIIPIYHGSTYIKSNGIFLTEPSTLSQMAALAILVEILEFRRLGYLIAFATAFLFAYSGTGLILILCFVPLAALRYRRARLPVGIVAVIFVALIVTGTIDLSAFTSRVSEFEDTRTSGFERFISPFWLAKSFLSIASPRTILLGNGPGTTDAFASHTWYTGFSGTWLKLFYEYGLMGVVIFSGFLAYCFRSSRCPPLLLAAILVEYVFLGGLLLDVSWLTIMIVLTSLDELRSQRERQMDIIADTGFRQLTRV